MSLYRKLILFVLAATALPLIIVGIVVINTAEDALRARIQDAQVEAVRAEAAVIGKLFDERIDALTHATGYFDIENVTDAERAGVVKVLYKAHDSVAVALLLDDNGKPAAPPAFIDAHADAAQLASTGLAGHPRADDAAVERLRRVLPRDRAVSEGAGAVVLSPVYGAPERGDTAVAVALPVKGPGGKLYVFAAEISLGVLDGRMRANETSHGELSVVDGDGRIVAHRDAAKLMTTSPLLASFAPSERGAAGAFSVVEKDTAMLGAHAPVPVEGLGWSVLAQLPASEAFAPVRKMRAQLGGAVVIVVALLLTLSALFVRGVRRGLGSVVEGAETFARGNLAHRIVPPPERELKELATTFNRMGEELGAARTKLEGWNEELEATVEQRTKQLKEAQARLLETQKLAAVGHLGAGVAHEINNPLAAVLGGVQNLILRRKKNGAADEDADIVSLGKIEKAARRCRDVTTTLLRFSQRSEQATRVPVQVSAVITDAVSLSRAGFEELGARVDVVAADAAVVTGDAGQLVQVLVHLLSNARTALLQKEHGAVRVQSAVVDGAVVLSVSDDGKGIDPSIKDKIFEPFFTTKDVWTNLGLGLSESFRIVEDHGGRIAVESEVGKGTTVTVTLPCASS